MLNQKTRHTNYGSKSSLNEYYELKGEPFLDKPNLPKSSNAYFAFSQNIFCSQIYSHKEKTNSEFQSTICHTYNVSNQIEMEKFEPSSICIT